MEPPLPCDPKEDDDADSSRTFVERIRANACYVGFVSTRKDSTGLRFRKKLLLPTVCINTTRKIKCAEDVISRCCQRVG